MTLNYDCASADEISFMFPDVDRDTIKLDLELTQNSELTINRILYGQLTEMAGAPKRKFNFKKNPSVSEQLSSKVHDISSSDSDDHDSGNIIQRINKVTSASTKSSIKPYRGISDSSHSEVENNLPDLEEAQDNFLQPETSSQLSSIVSSSQQSATSESSVNQFTDYDNSQSSTKPSPHKGAGGKRRKRTPDEIEESKKQALALRENSKKKEDEKKLERELKKKEQEFEKQRNRLMKEAMKNAKPGECLKHITVVLSPGVIKEKSGSAILDTLQKSDIKYDIQQQVHDNIITFWRAVTEVKEIQLGGVKKLESFTTEKVEDTILLLLPVLQFVTLVHNYKQKNQGLGCLEDLHDHIIKIKNSLEGRDVTVVVQGLEKYFRDQKTRENRAYKIQVQTIDGEVVEAKKRKKKAEDDVIISRLDVEEALVHLQLNDGCNVKFAELDPDIAKLVHNYTKAVAETPFKRDRLQTGFTFHLASSGSVHVDKEGVGLAKVWRQQLQQFQLVTAEVANAIVAVYPSPHALYQAYQTCETERKGERLLEDLEVRRGAGVMATTRRVGKELSRRLYQLFTSTDFEFVIL